MNYPKMENKLMKKVQEKKFDISKRYGLTPEELAHRFIEKDLPI